MSEIGKAPDEETQDEEAPDTPDEEAQDGPLNAEQAAAQVHREYNILGVSDTELKETELVEPIIVPPQPQHPDTGFAWIRILRDSAVHEFFIPSLELEFTQDEWTTVTADLLSEIRQIAAENQVLIETEEAPAEV